MTAPAMRGLAFFWLLFVSVVAVCSQKCASTFAVETAITAKSFAPIEFDISLDGEWVAYTLTDPRRRKVQGLPSDQWKIFTCSGAPHVLANTDLLISNIKTGQTINISSGKGANWDRVGLLTVNR
jgi:hypothetical protein